LAEQLGGETSVLHGEDVVATVLAFARDLWLPVASTLRIAKHSG
jgi:hypothetical protein